MMLNHHKVGDVTVAELNTPYLDGSNARAAEKMLTALVASGERLVLDLGRTEWMDSSGCCTVITLLKRLKEHGGGLKLCSLTPPVRTLFQIICLHKVVDIFNTQDEAVRAFAA